MLCSHPISQAVGLHEAVGLAHMSNYHTKFSSTGEAAPGAPGGSHHSNASSSYHSAAAAFVPGPATAAAAGGGGGGGGPGCLTSAQLADYQGDGYYQDNGGAAAGGGRAGSPAGGAWRPMSPFPAAGDAGGYPRVPNLAADGESQGGGSHQAGGGPAATYLGSQPLHR
jgi:hypothetical protein